MADFLSCMVQTSHERVLRARAGEPEALIRRRASDTPPAPPLCLTARGFDLIAEIKPRSPSVGALVGDVREPALVARAQAYVAAGAAVVSVITEPTQFGGDLRQLAAIARAVGRPTLRKDFLVDPYQVFEARVAGAAGVLLVVRLLDDARLTELQQAAAEAGLFVLLEAFDGDDLARCASRAHDPATLIGLNARDLTTLAIDPARHAELADRFAAGAPRVAESGIELPEDAARVAALGYRLALVGTALMRASDPGGMVAAMLDAGREAAARTCA